MELNKRIEEALLSSFKKKDGSINILAASKAIGVSRQAIMYWLRGESVHITFKNIKKIESATGYSSQWLMYEQNEDNKKQIVATHPKYPFKIKGLVFIPLISWHEISIYNHLTPKEDGYLTMIVEDKDGEVVSAKAYGIKMLNNDHAPYAKKGELVGIDPLAETMNKSCLVTINGEYHFVKRIMLDREYLQYKNAQEKTIPIEDLCDCKIIGRVLRITNERDGS